MTPGPACDSAGQLLRIVEQHVQQPESEISRATPTRYTDALMAGTQFIHQQFVEGASASTALLLRTEMIDSILKQMWQAQDSIFDSMALLAVGGYGRQELHPHSDIDIAILLPHAHDSAEDRERDEKLSHWITSLWDLNLDIGHSVRTVSDCEREAGSDITVITNLMEARLICGNEELHRLMQNVIGVEHMWPSAAFYAAKLKEQEQRRTRFQSNAYRLEPNIKESQGGLRDFQTIAWVCQRLYGTRALDPLVEKGLLEPQELDTLRDGLELLWSIRYWLHHVAGRREDRLLFDYQKDIAHAFGHNDDTDNRSIEQLMQRFYRTVMSLQRLNEISLQGIGGIISGVTAASEIEPINSRFHTRNGFLEVSHDKVFANYPPALLELFLVFGNTVRAEKVRSHTVRLIRANLHLINQQFRDDPVVRRMFVRIFTIPDKLTRTVRLMNRYGVLAAYLPSFDQIVGRMQYDLFHIFTVDEHTMGVIRNLRRLMIERFSDELPHGTSVAARIKRPYVLYLSALFHDIAKGRPGDHSELGAEEARRFARRHGMNSHDADLLEWTVRHHLLMSITAQRKDIDDPDEQLEFARQVGSIEYLDHLYLLTISDIRATNPELWTSFKQSLLQSLYEHTLLILQRGLDNPLEAGDVIAKRQARTLTLLNQRWQNNPKVMQLWKQLGEDYFRQYQPVEIARHTEILLAAEHENGPQNGPLVSLRYSVSKGSTEILIYTPDDKALFALISVVLERLQLNVLSATITTTDTHYALDTFHVLAANNLPVEDPDQIQQIKQTLVQELMAPKDIPALVVQDPSRRLRYFTVNTEVEFNDDESGLTEMRLTAADHPGILSSIGRILLNADISVHAARISTLGERIDDVFLLSNAHGKGLTSTEKQHIRRLLMSEI